MRNRFPYRMAALLAATITFGTAQAQTTPLKLQLDWRFEGPVALFLQPAAKGYFKAAGLDVTIDAGSGSGGTVTRVASGTYDMGFADMAALMEFHANSPDVPNKPVAIMMVYNNTPASVLVLKKSGIKTPADLNGKLIGAPVFEASRRAFPTFAKINGVTSAKWTAMDPTLRETMLIRGDVDAISGFSFTSLLNLEARGIKASDVQVFAYRDYGVKSYSNAIIASPKFLKDHPAEVRAFLKAFAKGTKEVIADPDSAIDYVKQRDGIINTQVETKRLKMAIESSVNTKDARAEGFGQINQARLSLMASQVSEAFSTKTRVNPDAVWDGSFLPSKAELDVLAVK